MCLPLGQNVDEIVEIGDTSASHEIKKFVIAVTWLYNVDNVFSLWPCDTSDISELSDKHKFGFDDIQQLKTIDIQRVHPSFV